MVRVFIIKTGSTVPGLVHSRGDFEDWFRESLGLDEVQAPVVAAHRDEPLPEADNVPGVIVTGSPSMVTDRAEWSVRCETWLSDLVQRETPILGVCYGHHLLAQACGGRVAATPRGREIGTVTVDLSDAGAADPLFAGLPRELLVQATHEQSVVDLPPGATVLAANDHDPCQAFALPGRAWGVQFHPEFDGGIVRGYLAERGDVLRAEGLDPDVLSAAAQDSPHGRAILQNFLRQI